MMADEFRITEPVLVVDDDEYMLDMIAQVLKSEGYMVIVAGNGAEAWFIVQDITPSVILLDMQMPVMDGFESSSCSMFPSRLKVPGEA